MHVLSEQSLPSLSDVQCLDKPRCDRSRLFFSAVLGGMASPVPVAPSRLEAEVDDTLKKKKKKLHNVNKKGHRKNSTVMIITKRMWVREVRVQTSF